MLFLPHPFIYEGCQGSSGSTTHQNQYNPNSTQKLDLTWKRLYTTHPPQTQCHQYLSCLPRFQPNFKVMFLEWTTTTTSLTTTLKTTTSTTSHQLMTRFLLSFKGRFLGLTTTITTTTTKTKTLTTTTSTTFHPLITWFQPNFKGMFLGSTTGITTTTTWTTTTTTPMTTTTTTTIFLGCDSIVINLV